MLMWRWAEHTHLPVGAEVEPPSLMGRGEVTSYALSG
jgi:hypothetical protein